jgi:hypothetical protein
MGAGMTRLTADDVRALLDYDPETGVFTWKARGTVAGCESRGYLVIRIGRTTQRAHRLAWLLTYGEWPSQIDHRDGNRSNNAISNLRLASTAQNSQNAKLRADSSTGFKGVSVCNFTGRFRAYINVDNKRVHLGRFNTAEEAGEAYKAAALKHFGEFARVA